MEAYASMWRAIIRPPRANYEIQDLGPIQFNIGHMNVVRTDIEITGFRNHKMQCSHFEPLETERQWDDMPCIIYMHGNSSCRTEAVDLVPYVLQANMTLFCFDFPGCGKSDGEFISLGWHERDDVNVIVNYLRS
jgi:cephalosporin-C deacetylase-like acetyl esterase